MGYPFLLTILSIVSIWLMGKDGPDSPLRRPVSALLKREARIVCLSASDAAEPLMRARYTSVSCSLSFASRDRWKLLVANLTMSATEYATRDTTAPDRRAARRPPNVNPV